MTRGRPSCERSEVLVTHFLAVLLDPLDHSSASAASCFTSSAAAFCAAVSAFRALPAAFLLPSEDLLPLPAMVLRGSVS